MDKQQTVNKRHIKGVRTIVEYEVKGSFCPIAMQTDQHPP